MDSERPDRPMTVGELSRHTGVPVKALRSYTDWGLIYTVGRSPANYRLYDGDARWCVHLIGELRGLGLTLAEIRDLFADYPHSGPRLGPALAQLLSAARDRIDAKIADLEQTRGRIDAFRAAHQEQLSAGSDACRWADDPRGCAGPA